MTQSEESGPTVVVERSGGGAGVGLFVAGIAIGAAVALLFAPQSGEETRYAMSKGARRAKRAARRLMDEGQDFAADTKSKVERQINAAGRRAAAVVHDLQEDGV